MVKKHDIDIEIFKEKNNSTNISTLNDKVKLFQITNVTSYIIKAIKNNRCVKIVTENIKNVDEIINTLEEIFNTSDNKNSNKLCSGNIKNKVKDYEKINYTKVKEDLLSLYNLKDKYSCIKTIEADYSHAEIGKFITNKLNNCDMEDETYLNSYGVSITVEKNNQTRVLYIAYYTKEYNFNEFKEYLLKKLEYLLIKLDSTSVETKNIKFFLQIM